MKATIQLSYEFPVVVAEKRREGNPYLTQPRIELEQYWGGHTHHIWIPLKDWKRFVAAVNKLDLTPDE